MAGAGALVFGGPGLLLGLLAAYLYFTRDK